MSSLDGHAAKLGLSSARALELAQGAQPVDEAEVFAIPGLRHGYDNTRIPGASSPEAYDLGLRLSAQVNRCARKRLDGSIRWSWLLPRERPSEAIVITPGSVKGTWDMRNGGEQRLCGVDATAIHDALAGGDSLQPRVLIVDCINTFRQLAMAIRHRLPAMNIRVSVLLRWWEDAMFHPGTGVFIPVVNDLRAMYATHLPDQEGDLQFWGRVLRASNRGHTNDLTFELAEGIIGTAREVPGIMTTEWLARFRDLESVAAKSGLSNSLPPMQQHVELRSMTEVADWHAGWLIAEDGKAAQAARWSGHVVDGTWRSKTENTWTFSIGEAPCRYRPGSTAIIAAPGPGGSTEKIDVDVDELAWHPEFGGLITVSTFGRPQGAKTLDGVCIAGTSLELRPPIASTAFAAQARGSALRRRRQADSQSWLANPERAPQPREVPWDVLAGAVGA